MGVSAVVGVQTGLETILERSWSCLYLRRQDQPRPTKTTTCTEVFSWDLMKTLSLPQSAVLQSQ